MKTALTIAGSDSSGGAGIQADIKTMIMNGVFAMCAVTAITAQNTTGVRSVQETSPDILRDQIDAVFEDIFPDAVKIGMVSSPALIEVITECLNRHKARNIVLDTVMVATSGARLTTPEAVKLMTEKLFPLSTLITPNIPEAQLLIDMLIMNRVDMEEAAKKLYGMYGCSVLIKGGHTVCDAADVLCTEAGISWYEMQRIDNPNTHGTGCTLSSAIAADLAKGYSLEESVKLAKEYLTGAIAAGLDLGKGSGPLDHGYDNKSRFSK
ncbi:MAG: bifunctional hydroxymethylpyrimidine kinase/phosphomethylpyrimidine kinase [Ruminococcus sp.]|nr:bifunctional hydroxymethylpyrimidine kinase/phosphomethylpyrimidine kinase [Ruminococcus sp.]